MLIQGLFRESFSHISNIPTSHEEKRVGKGMEGHIPIKPPIWEVDLCNQVTPTFKPIQAGPGALLPYSNEQGMVPDFTGPTK